MRIVGSCETDASGNLKFTIHQSKVTKKQAKVKVTKPKDKSIGEKIRYKQQKLHENDHANRFRGDYPLLAFLNKKDPKNYHMFELLEGAAVFASTDQFFEKNYKNESKRKKIQDAIGIYSNEELTHKREGESNLYDFHGVTRDVTYWDAYLLYKKEGEEGFIKAYKEFEERFLSTGIQEIVTDLLNKGGTKIEQGQVCNFTLEIKNTEQGTSYLLDPHIILDKNVKRYCGSCYVGDTMRSMCTNPACSNFGRKPSEAKPEKGAQRL